MGNKRKLTPLAAPRFEKMPAILITGIAARYNMSKIEGVGQHWHRFSERVGFVPERVGRACYGVYRHFDGSGFEYITGVEISGHSAAPEDFVTVALKEQLYAVFSHEGSIADIGNTHFTIWNQWLPESGRDTMPDGSVFEKYDERFDPATGTGLVEIWMPVKP